LAKESLAQDEIEGGSGDLESIMMDGDDDKTYAAMGVAKTIWTVSQMNTVLYERSF
jgi:importin-7